MAGSRGKPGRMGPFIAGFEARLLELGHTPGTVRNTLKVVGQLGRWMADTDLEVEELNEASIGAFISNHRAAGARQVSGARGFEPLLDYLRSQGVLPPATRPPTPVEDVIASYRTWLDVDRGARSPDRAPLREAGSSLPRGAGAGGRRRLHRRSHQRTRIDNLTSAHVIAFLLREGARLSVGAAKGRVAELRSLLRFLYFKRADPGRIGIGGVAGRRVAVGAPASAISPRGMRLSAMPRAESQVEDLFGSEYGRWLPELWRRRFTAS